MYAPSERWQPQQPWNAGLPQQSYHWQQSNLQPCVLPQLGVQWQPQMAGATTSPLQVPQLAAATTPPYPTFPGLGVTADMNPVFQRLSWPGLVMPGGAELGHNQLPRQAVFPWVGPSMGCPMPSALSSPVVPGSEDEAAEVHPDVQNNDRTLSPPLLSPCHAEDQIVFVERETQTSARGPVSREMSRRGKSARPTLDTMAEAIGFNAVSDGRSCASRKTPITEETSKCIQDAFEQTLAAAKRENERLQTELDSLKGVAEGRNCTAILSGGGSTSSTRPALLAELREIAGVTGSLQPSHLEPRRSLQTQCGNESAAAAEENHRLREELNELMQIAEAQERDYVHHLQCWADNRQKQENQGLREELETLSGIAREQELHQRHLQTRKRQPQVVQQKYALNVHVWDRHLVDPLQAGVSEFDAMLNRHKERMYTLLKEISANALQNGEQPVR